MKWKDTGDPIEKEEKQKEPLFDEEQYSPWSDRKESSKLGFLARLKPLYILVGLTVVACIALVSVLTMMFRGGDGSIGGQFNGSDLEKRIQQLEARLDNYENIDEKVTRIWEQAKSFEKFKDRFDRSEASTSLRIDHLTMSLESMQKQLNELMRSRTASRPSQPKQSSDQTPQTQSGAKYHKVVAGDTFYSISKQYNVSLEELLKMNQMKPDTVIMPGQQLIVGK